MYSKHPTWGEEKGAWITQAPICLCTSLAARTQRFHECFPKPIVMFCVPSERPAVPGSQQQKLHMWHRPLLRRDAVLQLLLRTVVWVAVCRRLSAPHAHTSMHRPTHISAWIGDSPLQIRVVQLAQHGTGSCVCHVCSALVFRPLPGSLPVVHLNNTYWRHARSIDVHEHIDTPSPWQLSVYTTTAHLSPCSMVPFHSLDNLTYVTWGMECVLWPWSWSYPSWKCPESCLSVCLIACLCACLVCLHVCLPTCLSVCLPACLSI